MQQSWSPQRLEPSMRSRATSLIPERFRHMGAPLANGAARCLQILGSIAVVPVLLRALGREEFAIWMAITSLFVATSFIDLGLGGALVNRLSAAEKTPGDSGRAVSSSIFGLGLLWGLAAISLLALYPSVDWDRVFGLPPGTRADPGPAAMVMLVALCAIAPLGLAGRIRLGLGQSHVHSLWDAVTSVLTLSGMLLSAGLGGGVTMVVLAAALAPLITLAANWAQLLRKQRWLTPRWRDANWPEFARLLHEGASFFFIALFGAAAFGCDSLIVVFTLGAKAAAEPMIALRLAAALQTLMAGMVLPYWPRLSRVAAGSAAERSRALRQTFGFIFLISTTAAGGLLIFGPAVVRLWTGGAVGLAAGLALPIAVWILVFGVAQGLLMVFSVAHLVRTQLIVAATSGILILLCKIGGAMLGGASGLVWGGTLALLGGAVAPLIVLLARDLRRQED